MKKEHAAIFSNEVEQYRKALMYFAQSREWEHFKDRAGRLFDYVERVEYRELERRFYRIFNMILGFLVITVIGIVTVDWSAFQGLLHLRQTFLLSALALGSYEIYYYIGFRKYVEIKSLGYELRRKEFILGIEQDFRGYAEQDLQKAA